MVPVTRGGVTWEVTWEHREEHGATLWNLLPVARWERKTVRGEGGRMRQNRIRALFRIGRGIRALEPSVEPFDH